MTILCNVYGGVNRSFNTPFVPSDNFPALTVDLVVVKYTIEMSVTAPLFSSQSVQIDLEATSPGGTPVVIDSISLSSAQGGGLSLLSLMTTSTAALTTHASIGFTLQLVKTGTGTATIIEQQETVLSA